MAIFGSRNSNEDERLVNGTDPRESRAATDRAISEDRVNSDTVRAADRYAMLRDTNTILPPAPDIPGFHTCWLTTLNNKDTLENRFRLGYTLVSPDELPGFCMSSQKDGAVSSDRISVNEMVLAKIPMDLFKGDVIELHHNEPLKQIKNLKDSVRIGTDGRGRNVAYSGGEFNNGAADGYADLGRVKAPTLEGIR